jgi:hypothetical protein
MSKPRFLTALENIVVPRLRPFGFGLDDYKPGRDVDYSFSKKLGDNTWARLTFQRHAENEVPYGYGFTIEIERCEGKSLRRRARTLDVHSFGTRLPDLITAAFGLRTYPSRSYWWEAATLAELQMALNDALDKLITYGVPVLEDSAYRYIGPISLKASNVFQERVDQTVAVKLAALGYEARDNPIQFWNPPRAKPHQVFSKALSDSLTAFISFHGLYRHDRPSDEEMSPFKPRPIPHHFGVLLARKRSKDPNAEISSDDKECFQGWLGPQAAARSDLKAIVSEAALWEYVELPGILFDYDEATKTPISTFPARVRESLTKQLGTAMDKVKQVGLPLLEDLDN